MTDEKMQKLAGEISTAIKSCDYCPIKFECNHSEYGECQGVWYEHIQMMENER